MLAPNESTWREIFFHKNKFNMAEQQDDGNNQGGPIYKSFEGMQTNIANYNILF